VLLFLTGETLKRLSLNEPLHTRAKQLFRRILIIYELMAIIILIAVFICIDPILHGMIFLFILLGSAPYLRSYISGRWIQFDHVIKEGVKIKTGDIQGIVENMGRIKMSVQSNDGLHDLSYNSLLSDGYTLVSGEKIGGFYHLELSLVENKEIRNHHIRLFDLMVGVPFIDKYFKPEFVANRDSPEKVEVRVLVKEERHLRELIALTREWGYSCMLLK